MIAIGRIKVTNVHVQIVIELHSSNLKEES